MTDDTRGPRPVPEPQPRQVEDPELLDLIAALQAESAGPHPPPATLLTYRRGDLDGDAPRRDEVRDHLLTCTACRNVLLDLADLEGGLVDGDLADSMDSAAEAARAEEEWRRLLDRLPAIEPGGTAEPSGTAAPGDTARRPTRSADAAAAEVRPRSAAAFPRALGWWAAAALLLVRLGLASQLARLSGPSAQGNVPVVYLDAVTRAVGGEEVPVPASDAAEGVVVLMVSPPDPGAYPTFTLELRGTSARWDLRNLRPAAPYGTLRVTLPARALAAGEPLQARLLGNPDGGGQPEELAAYRLVAAPGEAGSGADEGR